MLTEDGLSIWLDDVERDVAAAVTVEAGEEERVPNDDDVDDDVILLSLLCATPDMPLNKPVRYNIQKKSLLFFKPNKYFFVVTAFFLFFLKRF